MTMGARERATRADGSRIWFTMQPGDPLHSAASADEDRRRKPGARLLGPAELGPQAAALMDADNRLFSPVNVPAPPDFTHGFDRP
jgi:hypothetical protein